jgi:hypothetical protein
MNEGFAPGFLRTLVILQDYLPSIVVGGGWAPFLYYRYLAGNKDHNPILTKDIDFMVSHQIQDEMRRRQVG